MEWNAFTYWLERRIDSAGKLLGWLVLFAFIAIFVLPILAFGVGLLGYLKDGIVTLIVAAGDAIQDVANILQGR